MIGSRHEKAAIVAASYVIGFVTAFILYNEFTVNQTVVNLPVTEDSSAAAINAVSVKNEVAKEPEAQSDTTFTYQDGMFNVSVKGTENTLSFNPETSSLQTDTANLEQGYHYGKLPYTISKDSSFAFFCENHDADSESCAAYVYDVKADRIYPVTLEGKAVSLTVSEAADVIWTSLGLKVGSRYSANISAPWVLIATE